VVTIMLLSFFIQTPVERWLIGLTTDSSWPIATVASSPISTACPKRWAVTAIRYFFTVGVTEMAAASVYVAWI